MPQPKKPVRISGIINSPEARQKLAASMTQPLRDLKRALRRAELERDTPEPDPPVEGWNDNPFED